MTDEQIAELFRVMKSVVVVGISNNPARASYGVSRFLQRGGYRIIPVNPGHKEILGEPTYASVIEVPDPLEVVNIFRQSEHVPAIVDQLLGRKPLCIWLPEGVISEEARARSEAAGIPMVMDRCILKELARLVH